MAEHRQPTKYQRLALQIKEDIVTGRLVLGQQLPTEEALALHADVSRITVRQALTQLEQGGYIHKIQGKGSFVAWEKTQMQLNLLQGFSDEMRAKGFVPSTRLVQITQANADDDIARKLGTEEGTPLYKLIRLRMADDVPMCIETLHVPAHLCPALENEAVEGSMYSLFRNRYGHKLLFANQEIEAGIIGAAEAHLLHVREGSPALYTTRITYTDNNAPLEYVTSIYRGDRYRITARLEYNL